MKRVRTRLIVTAIGLATIGFGAAAETSLTIKTEMQTVVDPTSTLLFTIGSEVDPANGPGQPPTPAARWAQASKAAGELKRASVWLARPGTAKDQGDWLVDAKLMGAAANAALTAASAKDAAGLAAASNTLADTCTTCHTKYKPKTAG